MNLVGEREGSISFSRMEEVLAPSGGGEGCPQALRARIFRTKFPWNIHQQALSHVSGFKVVLIGALNLVKQIAMADH